MSYDSKLGRWIQQDPMEYVDGVGLYQYQHARPTMLVDPLGLSVKEFNPEKDKPRVEIGPEDPSYTCFGYALWRVGLNELIEDITQKQFVRNPNLKKVDVIDPSQVGDLYTYKIGDEDYWTTHVGVVTKVDEEGNIIEVESKLGERELARHHPRDPYVCKLYGSRSDCYRCKEPPKMRSPTTRPTTLPNRRRVPSTNRTDYRADPSTQSTHH